MRKNELNQFQESLSYIIEREKMLPISIPIKNSDGTYEMHHIGPDEIDFISPRVSANSLYPNIHPTVLTTFLEYKDLAYKYLLWYCNVHYNAISTIMQSLF